MDNKTELFKDYPDIVTVIQAREMLGNIGYKAMYTNLHNGSIKYFKLGKKFLIPKSAIIDYIDQITASNTPPKSNRKKT